MRNALSNITAILFASLLALSNTSADEPSGNTWYNIRDNGEIQLNLWFFWTEHCPHYRQARPHVEALPHTLPWLRLLSLQLDGHPEKLVRYQTLADDQGQQAREEQILKLLSGLMMSGLGTVLVFAPGLLDRFWATVALLLTALALTWIGVKNFPVRN